MLNSVQDHINALVASKHDENFLRQVLSLLDLTSLNRDDDEAVIRALCQKALTPEGHVAAVCIFPVFVSQAARLLSGSSVKVATVVNFPEGNKMDASVQADIQNAIQHGATEIDLVFPRQHYLAGDKTGAQNFVRCCKAVCGEKILLKVIIETGALPSLHMVEEMSRDAILAGADFLKTSTGKMKQGASLEAAAVMLLTIKEMSLRNQHLVGFKASGGIRTLEQAGQYIALAKQIMGNDWVKPETFRLGASQLLDVILKNLS